MGPWRSAWPRSRDGWRARRRRREHERLRFLTRAFGGAFLIFIGMFARYQILGPLQADAFVRPAFSQRQKGVPITLARGNILDRHGVPLNHPVWRNAVVSFPGDDEPPVKVARSLAPGEALESLAGQPGGLVLVPEEVRYGPESLARHVVGHVRPNAYLDVRDNLGESGLEKAFQDSLAGGTPAWSGVVVTAEGEDVPGTGLRIAPPDEAPRDLRTTIDASAQRVVEEVLEERRVERGAVVLLDALTSEVLAMASRPTFDQNDPGESMSAPGAPFVNRAISAFTPGSVFKPVIASLALERGYVTPDETFTCTGEVRVGGRTVVCGSTGQGHGEVTVAEALERSCNSALIEIGLRIPPAELVEFFKRCGFGAPTGLPLDAEAAGVLPDPLRMYPGDVANASIGQGRLSATPAQVAAFFASLAADGVYRPPSLVVDGTPANEFRLITPQTSSLIQDALFLGARYGTGRLAWIPGFGCAGKTGTAETGRPPGETHAWFCGWAPVLAPKYVMVVLVEEGGDGPSVAAPIFKEIAARLLDTHARSTP